MGRVPKGNNYLQDKEIELEPAPTEAAKHDAGAEMTASENQQENETPSLFLWIYVALGAGLMISLVLRFLRFARKR